MAIDVTERLGVSSEELARFCKRWKINELGLFGSILREDFSGDSDVDLLVTFADEADWGFSDYLRMEEELTSLLGRSVDLVERKLVEDSENYIRRRHILGSLHPIYPE